MRFVSWNVNGIRAVEKKGFVDIANSFDADIIALQETKASKEQLSDALINLSPYKSYWFSGEKKGYSSVAIYTKKTPINVEYGLGVEKFDKEGRVLIAEYEDFVIYNCYFPNAQHGLLRLDYRLEFNLALQESLTRFNSKTRIICGDFNVAHTEIDLKNPKSNTTNPGFTKEERAWMSDFLASGYVDTFRMFEKGEGFYTWWSYRFNARQRNIGWRIDYFCIDKESENRVLKAEILADVLGSDHCPVSLEIK